MFGIAIDIDDFDTDRRIQMRKASYKEIQKLVRENYNEHVTNLDNSNAKKELGITHNEYKGINAQECNPVRIREKKQKLVGEALKHFGFIEKETSCSYRNNKNIFEVASRNCNY